MNVFARELPGRGSLEKADEDFDRSRMSRYDKMNVIGQNAACKVATAIPKHQTETDSTNKELFSSAISPS
jgi:hypothetical protein